MPGRGGEFPVSMQLMERFDIFDRRILALLQRDASLALEDIGAEVGLSRNAVWRRARALEESGVIRRRVALLDPEKLGLSLTVFVLIRVRDHSAAGLERFTQAVRDFPEILGAYRTTGDRDFLLRVRVADMKAYDVFYQHLIRRVDLAEVTSSFVMEELKETTVLPVET